MNLTDEQLTALQETLTDDGDSAEIGAWSIRLHVEPDHETRINDYDVYGTVSDVQAYHNDVQERPRGFDGAARKVEVGRGEWVWWQPPDDLKSFKAWGGDDPAQYAEVCDDLARLVRDLCECGFLQVGLTLYEDVVDSLGAPHKVAVGMAWVGGIDSLGNGYLAEIIGDLVLELPDVDLPDVDVD